MTRLQCIASVGVAVAGLAFTAPILFGQGAVPSPAIEIPANATALEGIPNVRVDVAEARTTRRVLGPADAAKDRLLISVVDGQFYWTTRDNRRLRLNSFGDYTYLSSEPGKYIRLTRVNDKLSYVEHVDLGSESITWWGELKIVIGK